MKIRLVILTIICLIKTSVFCQTKNPLIENKAFIELVKKVNSLTKIIYNSNYKDLNNFKILENNIKSIKSESTIEECNKEIVEILNLPKGFNFTSEINSIKEISFQLKTNFSQDLTTSNIQDAINLISAQRDGEMIDFLDDSPGCKNQIAYAACCALAFSTAVGASIACSTAVLLLPVYIICQAAVLVAEAASIVLCYQAHCK